MSWKNIKLIFMREVRDQLRDRRTLFMVVILPLLMYPALGIGMMQMTLLFSQQPRTVVVLGTDDLPAEPALLNQHGFNRKLFPVRENAGKLIVVSDRKSQSSDASKPQAENAELLTQAREIRQIHQEREQLLNDYRQARTEKNPTLLKQFEQKIEQTNAKLSRLFQESGMQALVLVPEGFKESLNAENKLIADRNTPLNGDFATLELPIIHNQANNKSQIAYQRVYAVLEAWKMDILKQRLLIAKLPATLPTPVSPISVNLANQENISGSLWSSFFPAILVIMAVTGAFYPSIDLAAGEKERGTMETLLICPAARTEIVMGKFFTVMLFSMATALLNLMSMGFTGKHMASFMFAQNMSGNLSLGMPSLLPMIWVVVLLVPLAALFSALCLALATFARSSKEGQYYLTPILMVTTGLTVFCLSPSIEIEPFYSIMPVIGPTLLLKQLFIAPSDTATLIYILPVLVSSFGYSLLALWWAIDQFSREEVLFRESERFELRLWLRQIIRNKGATPTFTTAGFCFVLIMMLQFASLKFFSDALSTAESAQQTLQLQMISLLVTIACPALIMGSMLTTSFKQTFRIQRPKWNLLAVAAILPVVLHPISVEVFSRLDWFFPQLPESAARIFESMSADSLSIWFALLAFALAPAICEEIAFRGFILSGFCHKKRLGLAVLFSSLAFGIIHMIPQQVFNASLLGLVLGLLTIRSNSIFPAILFHFTYNALQVFRMRVDASLLTNSPAEWFIRVDQFGDTHVIRYEWTTLLLAVIIAVVLIRWLINYKEAEQAATLPVTEPTPSANLAETKIKVESPVSVS